MRKPPHYSQERLDELCDLILSEMGSSVSGKLQVILFIQHKISSIDSQFYGEYVKRQLEQEGLIEPDMYVSGGAMITHLGKQVLLNGGYLSMLDERRKEAERESELRRSAIAANQSTAQWNAWALRTRFWPHIIALLSLGVSMVALWRTWER